jgi:integrase
MAEHKGLHEAVEEYVLMRTARKAATTAANEAFVVRRFAASLGDIQVRHLRPQMVADWFYGIDGVMNPHLTRDRKHRAPIKASTHNYYRTRLAGFFRFCTQRGWLKVDLLMHVDPLPVPQTKRQQPAPHVLLGLLEVADNARDRAYLALAINTGLRASEIVALRVGDVDLDSGYLAVVIRKTGDVDDQPITQDLDVELRRWLIAYANDLERPLQGSDYLFPARKGSVWRYVRADDGNWEKQRTAPTWRTEKPLSHSHRVVQEALRRAGLPTLHEGTHTIRRAVARAFFDSMGSDVGYDAALRTVSALLHHKSSATTEKYLGLSSEVRRRDQLLRGQAFLTALVDRENVVDANFTRSEETA